MRYASRHGRWMIGGPNLCLPHIRIIIMNSIECDIRRLRCVELEQVIMPEDYCLGRKEGTCFHMLDISGRPTASSQQIVVFVDPASAHSRWDRVDTTQVAATQVAP